MILNARAGWKGDGQILCGNLQCHIKALAHVIGEGKGKKVKLAFASRQRADQVYVLSLRQPLRGPEATEQRQSSASYGYESGYSGAVIENRELGLFKESGRYSTLRTEHEFEISDLEEKPIVVSCPRCYRCSKITADIALEAALPASRKR